MQIIVLQAENINGISKDDIHILFEIGIWGEMNDQIQRALSSNPVAANKHRS